jgi:hypothetical protein
MELATELYVVSFVLTEEVLKIHEQQSQVNTLQFQSVHSCVLGADTLSLASY